MRGTDAPARPAAPPRGRLALTAALLGLLAALVVAPACRPLELEHPYVESSLPAHSREPEAERLIQALMRNEIMEMQNWMTPELRTQLRIEDISATSDRLRNGYGNPIGIVEEKVHREGELEWFSLLVLHARGKPGSPDRRLKQRLVLYQFALRGELLDRLLVREHLDVRHLKSPARRYTLVTRIHFVSTGEWTVSHGGKRRSTNYHHGSRGQHYAYDLVVSKGGRQNGGDRQSNKDYFCYGLPVLAPAPGTVTTAIDGIPENRPGERVLVVASGYDPNDGADPPPTPATTLVRVDGSLAAGGLKNAGEPLVLYFEPAAGPPAIVASYGNYITTDAAAHAGRSVVADPVACDLRRAWSSEPAGSASPGAP